MNTDLPTELTLPAAAESVNSENQVRELQFSPLMREFAKLMSAISLTLTVEPGMVGSVVKR
jgi:hypothetical protein